MTRRLWNALNLTFFIFFFVWSSFSQTSLSINQESDLVFSQALPGSSAETVVPQNNDNASTASFLVTGPGRTNFNIILPASATLTNLTPGGGPNTILVEAFASKPSGSSRTDRNGEKLLTVGATRAALPLNQSGGQYSGSFLVEVVAP